MRTVSIRVTARTRDIVHAIAEETNIPTTEVIEKAVEAYRRGKVLEEANAAYAALYQDPVQTREFENELDEWDATVADGLEDV